MNPPLDPVSKLVRVSRNFLSLILYFMLEVSRDRTGFPNQGSELLTPMGCSQQIAK